MMIRRGNSNDLNEIRELFTDTITHICREDYNNPQIDAWKSGAENQERWLKVIETQFVIIAEINGKMVGFGTLENGNYIDLFFIHKDFQRQGIARKLYRSLDQEARNRNEKILTADVSKTAKLFFEKMGFKLIMEQTVNIKGIDLINYKMEKKLN